MFDLSRITRSGLVRHVDYHESVGSTNDRALELAARDELPLPLLVLTERQTGGRGRGSNRWWSADGALTFSLLLEAPAEALPPETRSQVALVAGLAVCEALEPLAPRAQWRVKWPNDVYLNGGKVCGILCESAPGQSERLIVGIGINANNSMAGSQGTGARGQEPGVRGQEPGRSMGDSLPGAIALVDVDGAPRDLTEMLLAVLDRFEYRWSTLLKSSFRTLAADYRQRCLLVGKAVTANLGGRRVVGVCRGIDDCGGLVLATEFGQRTIVAGSIDAWEQLPKP
ncbi:MAG: biotin--[acetyl-CoA-carboxylase] ligase [Planctomycetaceae bacterium]|nr:biotin--[acetyl-CoA-carboxylase] ligase [Planctomycetaceae bacterium]